MQRLFLFIMDSQTNVNFQFNKRVINKKSRRSRIIFVEKSGELSNYFEQDLITALDFMNK